MYQAWLPKPKHDTNYVPCFPREGLRLAGVEAARTNPRGAGPSGTRSSRTRLPSTPPRDFAALSDTRIGTTTWVTGVGLDSNWASGRFQSDSENVTTHVIRCVDHPDTDVPLCVHVRLCGDSNANLNSCLDCFIKYVIRTMIVCIPPHVRHIHAHRYGVHCLACQQDRLARQPRTSRRRQL